MTERKKPPWWFEWAVWLGIAASIAIPAAFIASE